MNNYLFLDLETYSDIDITKCGVYKYAESENFEILLFAYAFNNETVQVVDITKEKLPGRLMGALANPNIIKVSHNANFERNALKNYYGLATPPEEWRCSMVKALTIGLPASLGMIGKAMHLPEDAQKDKAGKALISYFCKPCKPTKANGGRTRNLPDHDPEKWELFKMYCIQDVVTEIEIWNKLSKVPTTDKEQQLWELDQKINDYGVGCDIEMINNAIACNTDFTERMKQEAQELTGLSNPNSPSQLKGWLGARIGHEVTSLTKEAVPELIKEAQDDQVVRLLELRQLMSKTSIKKYQTMKNSRCSDGRIRGLLQFYGANHTGRWAGRLVQIQNLPQNHLPDLDVARNLVKGGKYDDIEFLFDSIPDTLSQLIRTAFIPREGNTFLVADFSAIEARVIAWLAGERWAMKAFKAGQDLYMATASQMFKVPIDSIKKGSPLRQKGKIATLACGFGGSVGALTAMDKNHSIPEEELPGLVKTWRAANKKIVKFWWDCDKAAKKAIMGKTTVSLQYGIKFIYSPGVLFIQLPSGRKLAYLRSAIGIGKYDNPVITYEGMEQTTKQWVTLDTYGPKIVENIVQAVARDCLGEAMIKVDAAGYKIAFHVHDEIIMEGFGSLDEVNAIFGEEISWASGLLLKAEGYCCHYYQKD